MSGMDSNTHYSTAEYAVELVPSNREPILDATVAQAYATLALAYEQRTANLIALYGTPGASSQLTVAQWEQLTTDILDRLGLGND